MSLHGERSTRETQFIRIAQKAKANPLEQFTSLAHHLTEEYLLLSFDRLRKSASSGLDDQSWNDYQQNLTSNIKSLHKRLKSGTYKVTDIKRVWIDKGKDAKRPLGISNTEDKIVQRAVCDLLQLIYEQDFHEHSYGFRPKRSAHQALSTIVTACLNDGIRFIYDADISQCFDSFDHKQMHAFLGKRIKDKTLLGLINQWLKVGVLDKGVRHVSKAGTPQGNIISPLLCNIYLHYVLDEWLAEIAPLLKGKLFKVRYADDFILGFQHKYDADRVIKACTSRMNKYKLNIHPEKSKLISFRPYSKSSLRTFDFLGFTHYWGKMRNGKHMVKRKTSKKSSNKAMNMLRATCKSIRHKPIKTQQKLLSQKLHGLHQYFGIRGNSLSIQKFNQQAILSWHYWLNKRSQKKSYTWQGFLTLLKMFPLPISKII